MAKLSIEETRRYISKIKSLLKEEVQLGEKDFYSGIYVKNRPLMNYSQMKTIEEEIDRYDLYEIVYDWLSFQLSDEEPYKTIIEQSFIEEGTAVEEGWKNYFYGYNLYENNFDVKSIPESEIFKVIHAFLEWTGSISDLEKDYQYTLYQELPEESQSNV